MRGDYDDGMPEPSFERHDDRRGWLVNIDQVVTTAQAVCLERMPVNSPREPEPVPPSPGVTRCVVSGKLIDDVSVPGHSVMDETHDPAHAPSSGFWDIVGDKDSHARVPANAGDLGHFDLCFSTGNGTAVG